MLSQPMALVFLYVVFCILVGICGSQRRMGFTGTFIFSLLVTPVVRADRPADDRACPAPREIEAATNQIRLQRYNRPARSLHSAFSLNTVNG